MRNIVTRYPLACLAIAWSTGVFAFYAATRPKPPPQIQYIIVPVPMNVEDWGESGQVTPRVPVESVNL